MVRIGCNCVTPGRTLDGSTVRSTIVTALHGWKAGSPMVLSIGLGRSRTLFEEADLARPHTCLRLDEVPVSVYRGHLNQPRAILNRASWNIGRHKGNELCGSAGKLYDEPRNTLCESESLIVAKKIPLAKGTKPTLTGIRYEPAWGLNECRKARVNCSRKRTNAMSEETGWMPCTSKGAGASSCGQETCPVIGTGSEIRLAGSNNSINRRSTCNPIKEMTCRWATRWLPDREWWWIEPERSDAESPVTGNCHAGFGEKGCRVTFYLCEDGVCMPIHIVGPQSSHKSGMLSLW
jgi:hypothetical protein